MCNFVTYVSSTLISYIIGHDDEMTSPRNDPTENDQDLRTPATTNKQRRAAHNESTQTRLTQQSNRTTQGSEDDIDVEEIATRERESDREREGEREGERERANDVSGREKGRKRGENGTERESERETRRERATRRETKTRREKEHERDRGRERDDISQTGSRSRSTNSNNASVITDDEERLNNITNTKQKKKKSQSDKTQNTGKPMATR